MGFLLCMDFDCVYMSMDSSVCRISSGITVVYSKKDNAYITPSEGVE
jgi:hypothetical protein